MKKLAIFLGLLGVMGVFTSCEDDTTPVCQKPSEFVLNTPAMAEQYYELTPDGEMVFTCSQPDYGFTASVTYGIQVSLNNNFTDVAEGENPNYMEIPAVTPTSAMIAVKMDAVAIAMCTMRGIETEDAWDNPGATSLFVRATAQLGSHGDTYVTSNVIELKRVKYYFAVPQPAYIYLVGQPSGWTTPNEDNAAHYADWRLYEQEIGSNIFYGVFDIPAGNDAIFRFYTALTGWDEDSWGSQEEDSPIDYDNPDGTGETITLVKGKGSFRFPDWEGGEMTIIVNMNANTVSVFAGNQM